MDSDTRYRRFSDETHTGLQNEVAQIEHTTTTVYCFLNSVVPGLLQTREYARATFEQFAPLLNNLTAGGTGQAAVEARMRRQTVLDDPDKLFHFVLTEAALRTRVCDSASMRAQMERLIRETRRGNVQLGIVPLDAVMKLNPFHGFTIRNDRVVEIEMFTGQLELTGSDDLRLHRDVFGRLSVSAVYGEPAQELLTSVAASFA